MQRSHSQKASVGLGCGQQWLFEGRGTLGCASLFNAVGTPAEHGRAFPIEASTLLCGKAMVGPALVWWPFSESPPSPAALLPPEWYNPPQTNLPAVNIITLWKNKPFSLRGVWNPVKIMTWASLKNLPHSTFSIPALPECCPSPCAVSAVLMVFCALFWTRDSPVSECCWKMRSLCPGRACTNILNK